MTGVTGVTYGAWATRPPTSPRSHPNASSEQDRHVGPHHPDPPRAGCHGSRADGRRAHPCSRRGRGHDSLGPGRTGSGRQAAVHQPGHAGQLHRAGLRPVPRPRAVQDGRLAGGVAVPRRRHLHLGRLPRLPRPAQPHPHLDQHPADERLAPAADHARPAGQLPPRVPALRQRPGDQRQAQLAGPLRQGVPPGHHRGVDRGRRGAGARDRAGQHAVVRPRGVRRQEHHAAASPRCGSSARGPSSCTRSATSPASTPAPARA